ncbi:hypothetical protein U9M48_044677 [Paspalum notatum var. saurae]|uniref:Senescence regulator n=1 Tax=Paspalum notatum var. saurae TaxID=547442 RepID=A0AAQ3XIT3_PASNO
MLAIAVFPPKEECLFAKTRHRILLLPKHTAIYSSGRHGHRALPVTDGEAIISTMEEFQEAEILWPGSNGHGDSSKGNAAAAADGAELMIMPSVQHRPKAAEPRSAAKPVEISRRKRRCRPWPSSEHADFDQETDASDDVDEEGRTDEAKGATSGLLIVPPHVLVARRRLAGGGRTAAYSMCAGKGRTLKGRDLRDVRNLVLKMTGFIEK